MTGKNTRRKTHPQKPRRENQPQEKRVMFECHEQSPLNESVIFSLKPSHSGRLPV
jgi:hypothetical protein